MSDHKYNVQPKCPIITTHVFCEEYICRTDTDLNIKCCDVCSYVPLFFEVWAFTFVHIHAMHVQMLAHVVLPRFVIP